MAVNKNDITKFFLSNLKAAMEHMPEAFAEAMKEKEEDLLDVNRQQLDRGKDAKGESLGRYKNFKYKNRYEPVDLKLTNDFRSKMFLSPDAQKKRAEIESTDEKSAMLQKRYGKEIFGIAQPYKNNVAETIKTPMFNKLKEKLFTKS